MIIQCHRVISSNGKIRVM
ncbi:hypothetical protein JFL43_09405 [Viridibacillus sp. YIM B01967]|uniref:Uncharacterized protein n=1 Tax=Viridibacillus soli TaxID=2798301 RepID=A0ABS1H7H4_9BACL|nr:hypothetical protein [Viridibacillus soli]